MALRIATFASRTAIRYVRVLTDIVAGLGGSLEAGAVDLAATFEDRQILIRFTSG
jgi:hypothetical protein